MIGDDNFFSNVFCHIFAIRRIAKIIKRIPSRDGKIRTVKLKTQDGTVLRPVQRIHPLEIQANENCVTEEVAYEGGIKFEKGCKCHDPWLSYHWAGLAILNLQPSGAF
ncbi:hypothetical protein TNCV_2918671 [Trichonephila clavipes]|nr:hypothetical protein TNCV_2918671 [Trichonephila clavipes]